MNAFRWKNSSTSNWTVYCTYEQFHIKFIDAIELQMFNKTEEKPEQFTKKRKEISWQQLKPTFYWADAKENLKINFLLLFPCTELPLLFSQFQYTQK